MTDTNGHTKRRTWRRRILSLAFILSIFVVLGGFVVWQKFFREIPQEPFATPGEKFMYGSLGTEELIGIPYPLFVAIPRVFGDLLPGPGGLRSLGFAWEEGKPLPAGFSLKTVGFPRVGVNCAVCHTATWRSQEDETPHVVPAGPGHTSNPQAVLRFLSAAAHDPRWEPALILPQILMEFDLSWLDVLLYKYVLIPGTRRAIFLLEDQFAWMDVDRPDWGPGRDDPMNLTKFNLGLKDWDETTGNADFPSIWNLGKRRGHELNWAGETLDAHAVLSDSAMGLGLLPKMGLEDRVQELLAYLEPLQPPPYPFEVDAALAAAGKPLFDSNCAECHAFDGPWVGTTVPVERVGTDRHRFDTWQLEDANRINRIAGLVGSERTNMTKQDGYASMPLDGIWLRAPYLHNGSIPTLADLLEPPDSRPVTFYRGYDVYDPTKVGFVSEGESAARTGFLLDTRERGNGNGGHLWGTELAAGEKRALIEYLKTL